MTGGTARPCLPCAQALTSSPSLLGYLIEAGNMPPPLPGYVPSGPTRSLRFNIPASRTLSQPGMEAGIRRAVAQNPDPCPLPAHQRLPVHHAQNTGLLALTTTRGGGCFLSPNFTHLKLQPIPRYPYVSRGKYILEIHRIFLKYMEIILISFSEVYLSEILQKQGEPTEHFSENKAI